MSLSMLARRTALQAARLPLRPSALSIARRAYADTAANETAEKKDVLSKGAKKDPELYILLTIMTGAFALAGWHFSSNPTSSSSENAVSRVEHSEPWKTGGEARYQYHPGGDTSKAKRDAPSALNEVIIPAVNLPKELHEKYNKWGKEGF